jgi:hypothetical protein
MEGLSMQQKQKRSVASIIITIVLSVVLGVGGYFGGLLLFGGGGTVSIPLSSNEIPIDSNGNNLVGNTPENMQNGGLFASQGDTLFFVNFADGGSLYCEAPDIGIFKLTDFPVANINITGDVLMFTDLEACTVSNEYDAGTVSGLSHAELGELAGRNGRILYGGNLYAYIGIREFYEGKRDISELRFIKMNSGNAYYQGAVLNNGTLTAIEISRVEPGMSSVPYNHTSQPSLVSLSADWWNQPAPGSSFGVYDYDWDLPKHLTLGPDCDPKGVDLRLGSDKSDPVISKYWINPTGEDALVQVWGRSEGVSTNRILHIDAKTGKVKAAMSGGEMVVHNSVAYFLNQNDRQIYAMSVPPSANPDGTYNYHISQVSSIPHAGGEGLKVDSQGNITYGIIDPQSGMPTTATISQDSSKTIGGQRYQGAAPMDHPHPGFSEQYFTYANLPGSGHTGPNHFRDRQGFTYLYENGEWYREYGTGGNVYNRTKIGEWTSHLDDIREGPPEMRSVCEFMEEINETTPESDSESKPEPPTIDIGTVPQNGCSCGDDCNEDFCDCALWMQWNDWSYWYKDWEDWKGWEDSFDTVGERAPSARHDDPDMSSTDFLPQNLKEYAEFNTANGGSPPSMEKALLIEDLMGLDITFKGTTTTRFDYLLDSQIHLEAYRREMGASADAVTALQNFSRGGGFIGDVQDTTIRLVFEHPDFDAVGGDEPYVFNPKILVDMKDGPNHTFGPDGRYTTGLYSWKSSRVGPQNVPSLVWYNCDGYLIVTWDDGSRESGLVLSLGRDADSKIIGHGWYLATDETTSRTFTEVLVTESARKATEVTEKIDMSIFDGVWFIRLDLINEDSIMEIRDGQLVRYEANGKQNYTSNGIALLGELVIYEDNLYVILSNGNQQLISSGKVAVDGDVLRMGDYEYRRQ